MWHNHSDRGIKQKRQAYAVRFYQNSTPSYTLYILNMTSKIGTIVVIIETVTFTNLPLSLPVKIFDLLKPSAFESLQNRSCSIAHLEKV